MKYLYFFIIFSVLGGTASYYLNKAGFNTHSYVYAPSRADVNEKNYADKVAAMRNATKLYDINMLQDRPEENPDMYKLSLPNKGLFYLKIPGTEELRADYCGSGGCEYSAYVVNNSNHVSQVTDFDSYSLDCDTQKISLFKNDSLFGTLNINKANRVVRILYSFSGYQAAEDIYHIDDNGFLELIASYNQICDYKETVTLFRNKSFPSSFSEPFNSSSGWNKN